MSQSRLGAVKPAKVLVKIPVYCHGIFNPSGLAVPISCRCHRDVMKQSSLLKYLLYTVTELSWNIQALGISCQNINQLFMELSWCRQALENTCQNNSILLQRCHGTVKLSELGVQISGSCHKKSCHREVMSSKDIILRKLSKYFFLKVFLLF